MHRFFLLLSCVAALFLNVDTAFAQFTTRQSSAVRGGSSGSGAGTTNSGSLRFTRSSSGGTTTVNTPLVSVTTSEGAAPSKAQGATRATSQSSSQGATKRAGQTTKAKTPSSSDVDEDLDIPNFRVVSAKGTEGMSQAQKIILLEEFARKRQEEREADAKAKAAKKAAIAKKIAEETPAPGMVFDEEGIERPIPKGEVWIYVSNFKQGESKGRVHCSLDVVLQNRTNTKLDRLEVDALWPSYSTTLSFSNVAPNATVPKGLFMFSPNCPSLRTKPRISPKGCVIGPMKEEACHPYIILK